MSHGGSGVGAQSPAAADEGGEGRRRGGQVYCVQEGGKQEESGHGKRRRSSLCVRGAARAKDMGLSGISTFSDIHFC